MQKTIRVTTHRQNELVDITEEVKQVVRQSQIGTGLVHVFVQGATAGIMIQENWDQSVQTDVLNFLRQIIPRGVWEHDRQDGNGDAHLKSGLIGPGETIPIINSVPGLSTWQNIYLCEFDGPRSNREIVITVLALPDRNL